MARKTNGGFTLIELILFLALSGLFLMIAFSGVSGRTGRVQFTDSMRSLSNYLQRQFSDTLNGVNSRVDTTGCQYSSGGDISASGDGPGRSECTVMGKVVVFDDDSPQADVYVVVGRFLTQTVGSSSPNYLDPTLSDEALILAAEPRVLLDQLDTMYEMEWQTEFVASGSDRNALAFIRSPRSSNIYPVTLDAGWSGGGTVPLDTSNIGVNANYCFLGANGQDAEIILGGNNRADGVELVFDTGCST